MVSVGQASVGSVTCALWAAKKPYVDRFIRRVAGPPRRGGWRACVGPRQRRSPCQRAVRGAFRAAQPPGPSGGGGLDPRE
eukprot:7393250-Lingulodinium_polyedra.AAC.1